MSASVLLKALIALRESDIILLFLLLFCAFAMVLIKIAEQNKIDLKLLIMFLVFML
jgi:uncharacterized membrane protein